MRLAPAKPTSSSIHQAVLPSSSSSALRHDEMPVVYFHGWLHEDRVEATEREFADGGLCFSNQLCEDVARRVKYVVTKARPIDCELLAKLPMTRAIVVQGTNPWMIDISRDDERLDEPKVLCLEEDRGYEVAEHAVALLLATLKRFPDLVRWKFRFSPRSVYGWFLSRDASETRGAHNWTRIETETLHGKTVGLVGYGAIGHQIHRRLQGYGAKFAYYHHRPLPRSIESRLQLRHLELRELFEVSDVIFLQLPHNELTDGIVGRELLMNCKPGLRIVNCGRAKVVEPNALYQALRAQRVAHYAADVFWREPMPLLSRFRLLSNCWITPHMAESLPNRKHQLNELTIQRIQAFEKEN